MCDGGNCQPRVCLGKHAAYVHLLHVHCSVWWKILFSDQNTCLLSEAQPTPPNPAYSTLSLILSLIFLTWVMTLVITNDSRNKSTVMRSHWTLFFSFLWNHPSQLRTINLFLKLGVGSGSKLQWTSVKLINSFLEKTFLQPKWKPCPSEHVWVFFQYPRLIISWLTGAHILVSC